MDLFRVGNTNAAARIAIAQCVQACPSKIDEALACRMSRLPHYTYCPWNTLRVAGTRTIQRRQGIFVHLWNLPELAAVRTFGATRRLD